MLDEARDEKPLQSPTVCIRVGGSAYSFLFFVYLLSYLLINNNLNDKHMLIQTRIGEGIQGVMVEFTLQELILIAELRSRISNVLETKTSIKVAVSESEYFEVLKKTNTLLGKIAKNIISLEDASSMLFNESNGED